MWYVAAGVYRVERQADFVFETPRAYKRLHANVNEEAKRGKKLERREGTDQQGGQHQLGDNTVRPSLRS